MLIYTIGHSTRQIENFVRILKHYKINLLIDVRRFPSSKHNPQFNQEELKNNLKKNKINYYWLNELGGFRKEGYKKFILSKEFNDGIKKLIKISKNKKVAIMCAELLWFKCHRRYIADKLKTLKHNVLHISDENKFQEHKKYETKIKCD